MTARTRPTDALGRRGLFAGLDVGGHLLELGGADTKAGGALGGGQGLGRGLAVFRGALRTAPVARLRMVVARRQRAGDARAIGAAWRRGADSGTFDGAGEACAVGANDGGGGLRLLGEERHGGEQNREEDGCSHSGVPFCELG